MILWSLLTSLWWTRSGCQTLRFSTWRSSPPLTFSPSWRGCGSTGIWSWFMLWLAGAAFFYHDPPHHNSIITSLKPSSPNWRKKPLACNRLVLLLCIILKYCLHIITSLLPSPRNWKAQWVDGTPKYVSQGSFGCSSPCNFHFSFFLFPFYWEIFILRIWKVHSLPILNEGGTHKDVRDCCDQWRLQHIPQFILSSSF